MTLLMDIARFCIRTICCLWATTVFSQLPPVEVSYIPGLPLHVAPRDIVQDADGMLWLGYVQASTGIFVYDGTSLRHIQTRLPDSTALSDQYINALSMGPGGTIWIGTYSQSVCVYHPDTDQFGRINIGEKVGITMNYIHDFIYEPDGFMWISGIGGLVRHDPKKDTYQLFRMTYPTLDDDEVFLLNRMRVIRQDPFDPDRMWIGTLRGLIAFDKRMETFSYHMMPYSATEQLKTNNAQYLVLDVAVIDQTYLAIGTWSGGMMIYNYVDGSWAQYRDADVPPIQDVVYRIIPRNTNELWIASTHGFGIFYRDREEYVFYDSIPSAAMSNEIGRYASAFEFINTNEAVVLGSVGGSVLQFPGPGPSTSQLYPPVVRTVYVDGALMPPSNNRYAVSQVNLTSEQNSVTFEVLSPRWRETEAVTYRYQLIGYDKTWRVESGPLKIQYSDLKGGKYQFQYQASLDGSTWIDGETWVVEKFTTFWRSSEFQLFAGGVLGAGVLLFVILVTRQRRKQAELERSYKHLLAESEMSALRAQMNPHFIFNSLNSIKTYILKQDTAQANKYLTRFSHLMRLVLRNSKSRLVTLADELHALKLYIEIEKLRFDNGFDSEIRIDDNIDTEAYYIPPLLLQPYVENAIWHGLMHKKTRGSLRIDIKEGDDNLYISIADDGIGRKRSGELQKNDSPAILKSYGTQITRDRIELIRQSLQIDARVHIEDLHDAQGNAEGTRVTVILPQIDPKMAKQIAPV